MAGWDLEPTPTRRLLGRCAQPGHRTRGLGLVGHEYAIDVSRIVGDLPTAEHHSGPVPSPTEAMRNHADERIDMCRRNARYSADPVDLGAQSDLIGAPESVSTEAVLAAPIGGVVLAS